VRNEEGPIPPHIANQQAASPQASAFAPWITDRQPGILTTTADFAGGEIVGLVHGLGLSGGSTRLVVEQWLLMKESVPATGGGLKLDAFPPLLPLLEQGDASTGAGSLFWGSGRYPHGYPAKSMTSEDFYDWAVPIVAPKEHAVAYALGLATALKGIPPDHLLAGSATRPVDGDTEGITQTISFEDGCRVALFAETRFSSFTNPTQEPFFNRFERSRRLVQAYDLQKCSGSDGAGSRARIEDSARKTYREWREAIQAWNGAGVSYADGVLLIDDDFKGEPMTLKDVRKASATLLAPKK